MEPTVLPTSTPCAASQMGGAKPRIAFTQRKPVAGSSSNKEKTFRHCHRADFKRMKAVLKVRAASRPVRTLYWLGSTLFHAILVAAISFFMLAGGSNEKIDPVTIVNVTIHQPLPEVIAVRPPELLLAESAPTVEPEESPPLPQESPAQEVPAVDTFVDAPSEDPAEAVAVEAVAAADIISTETDFSRVKYRGTARGVSSSTVVSEGPQVASTSSTATAPLQSVVVPATSASVSYGISQSARPQSISGGAYPKRAIKEKREGVVQLRVEVLPTGGVGITELYESSGHSDLDETALAAARNWRFTPAMRGDVAVSMILIVPVRYQLRDAR